MQTDGVEIVRRRQMLGWQQVDLARTAKLSQAWLSRIEGGSDPGPRAVKRIADALGCEISDILRNVEPVEQAS
jgi:transcriptional regulator with XRE-family HTH domain